MEFSPRALFCSLIVMASVVLCSAKIGQMDDYWRNRLDNANAVNQANFHPEPMHIVSHINKAVHHAMDQYENTTRRSLRNAKYNGPCEATNPIDRCWRCRKDWAENRKHYATCVKGFGHKTRGGMDGEIYVVTDPRDNELVNLKPGTLRYAVTRNVPLWIVFAHDMNIELQQELIINSNKTIDGRGAVIHIRKRAGFTIQGVDNVIITNIRIHDIVPGQGGMIRNSEDHFGFRTRSDGDGISIMTSSNVWIDHVSFSNCSDGIIDIVSNSTAITVSNCHLTKHNDVMLLGASDKNVGDDIMQVTIAFNHFGRGLVQRMPRARRGFVHVLNNDYTHWLMYAIGGSKKPVLLTQGNRFVAPPLPNAKEVTKREYTPQPIWMGWNWRSEDNLFMNGAFFVESGKQITHNFNSEDVIKAKPGTYVSRLTRFAGPLPCRAGHVC